jgi:hypothetical protein
MILSLHHCLWSSCGGDGGVAVAFHCDSLPRPTREAIYTKSTIIICPCIVLFTLHVDVSFAFVRVCLCRGLSRRAVSLSLSLTFSRWFDCLCPVIVLFGWTVCMFAVTI